MSRRIVVLDGHTLTPARPGEATPPGEPSWDHLAELGKLIVHPRTPREDVAQRIADASVVLTNKTPIGADELSSADTVDYIGVMATGVNVIDLDAARVRNIVVTNAPAYSTDSVAQHVFSLLLELTNRVAAHSESVRGGGWAASPDFCFTISPLSELAGKVLGIVGLGAIGRRVATIGHAFGMTIAAAHQRSMHRVTLPGVPIDWLPIEELASRADVLTLHCPLTPKTQDLVNDDLLRRMKPSAILINTSRGPLVNEAALAQALHDGRIAGASLDVLREEPPRGGSPLLDAPRTVITPHIAWATRESRCRLMETVVANVRAFLAGKPVNVVNPPAPAAQGQEAVATEVAR